MASERVLEEWMALCRKASKDSIAAAVPPVRIHRAASKPDSGNSSEGVSIFTSSKSQPTSDHLEQSLEPHSDLEQVLASFGAFCKLKAQRLEADDDAVAAVGIPATSPRVTSQRNWNHLFEGASVHSQSPITSDVVSCSAGQLALASEGVLKEWMAMCRKIDKGAIDLAGPGVRIHGPTSKPDAGKPSEGVSIFSSFKSLHESDHTERPLESHSDLAQVLASFGAFCKLKAHRLEASNEAVAAAAIPATSPRVATQQNWKHLFEGALSHRESPMQSDWVSSLTEKLDSDPSDIFLQTPSDSLQKRRQSESQPLHYQGVKGLCEKISRARSCDIACGRRSRQRKRCASAVHPRVLEIRTRRCSSWDGRDARQFA